MEFRRSESSQPNPTVASAKGVNTPLVENVDYYIEQGRWVFTAVFHRKRGHCCGSGCRHCPYEHCNVPPADD
ncbi:DUF5522 domain-containing protein [Humisphaera borealis]|uniref:Uncharacterized protein n=1 Tax=Humisphaera borealis TaxID=2807512 RepID=A0A7M2WYA0_9BACT|nr:hypothetical protein IPV69_03175 [Humisphaera borealis]